MSKCVKNLRLGYSFRLTRINCKYPQKLWTWKMLQSCACCSVVTLQSLGNVSVTPNKRFLSRRIRHNVPMQYLSYRYHTKIAVNSCDNVNSPIKYNYSSIDKRLLLSTYIKCGFEIKIEQQHTRRTAWEWQPAGKM